MITFLSAVSKRLQERLALAYPAAGMNDARKPYHHGNLTSELIAATIALIEEEGVEALSVRAVARKLGVSPGAPFRHFSSKAELLAAVAEQATTRLRANIDAALERKAESRPIEALQAMGEAYLRWAAENPTHFQIVSSRTLVDVANMPSAAADNAYIRARMEQLIRDAQNAGDIAKDLDVSQLLLSIRAFAYGLARMRVDGHLPEWYSGTEANDATAAALRLFLGLLAKR
jgi:AcrR family transcriptional regulator